jgi:hypothetical protein
LPPNTNKNLTLSNNPYSALSFKEDDLESSQDSPSETGMLQEPNRLLKGADTDTVSTKTSTKTAETESSNTTLSSQEKVLLSRKTQQALRKLRLARKALTDLSIREELEAVYGVEDASQLADITLDQALKPLVGKDEVEKGTNHANQEKEDMIIDHEDDNTPKDDDGIDGTARISSIGDGPALPLRQANVSSASDNDNVKKSKETNKKPQTSFPSTGSKNVSFAEAANSHSLRRGYLCQPEPPKQAPNNPYAKKPDEGLLHVQRPAKTPAKADKIITLKKGNFRLHTHRYTLRLRQLPPSQRRMDIKSLRKHSKDFWISSYKPTPKQ